jgi:hypothetical protein
MTNMLGGKSGIRPEKLLLFTALSIGKYIGNVLSALAYRQ